MAAVVDVVAGKVDSFIVDVIFKRSECTFLAILRVTVASETREGRRYNR